MRSVLIFFFILVTTTLMSQEGQALLVKFTGQVRQFNAQLVWRKGLLSGRIEPMQVKEDFAAVNDRISRYKDIIIPKLVWKTQCSSIFIDEEYFRDKDFKSSEFHYYQ